MLLRDLSNSVPMWPTVPTPGGPYLHLSPPLRAATKKSRALLLAGTPGWLTGAVRIRGDVPMRLSGARSLSGSEGTAGVRGGGGGAGLGGFGGKGRGGGGCQGNQQRRRTARNNRT